MTTQIQINFTGFLMTDQKTFFSELGERLTLFRKEAGLTQVQLAELARCSQQMIAEYEAGKRNIPVWRLINLAEVLGLPLDKLAKGGNRLAQKRGPASKIERLTEQISRLPRSRQQFVIEMIENAVAKAH